MEYNLNLDKVLDRINSKKARLVCIQLPDGLKPRARDVQEQIESKTDAKVIIWAGSCFGACDIPDIKNVDLLIQWGHSEWKL